MPVSFFSPGIIIAPQLIIVLGVILIGLIYFLSKDKKLPAWFKGGLISGLAIILILILDNLLVMFTLPIFVLGTILGTIVGHINKGERTKQDKFLKAGLWIGLILSIIWYSIYVFDGKWRVPAGSHLDDPL